MNSAVDLKRTVTPFLKLANSAALVDFLVRAFGAVEQGRLLKPDGTMLRWRSQDLFREPESVLPFVIEWDVSERLHPGRSAIDHPAVASGISSVVLGHPEPEQARLMLERAIGRGIRREVRENDWPGVLEVRVATLNGELVVS